MQLTEVRLKSLLQRRLARLMAPPRQYARDATTIRTVQQAIVEVASKLNRPGWLAYLVGGTLRDLLVVPNSLHNDVEPRDVDIIVGGASQEQMLEVLRDVLTLERPTRFGGLHLSKLLPSGSRVLFDIWALSDNWGFRSQNIDPRIEDFPGTTFLNIDSCAIELQKPPGRQRGLFEKGFFGGIANRVIDMNYAPNPYPYVCVARTLVLAARLNFTITRPLVEFILRHTATGGIDSLLEAQRSHYGMIRSDAHELGIWLNGIRRQFDSGKPAISIEVSHARQLELWHDYPKLQQSESRASI